MRQTRINGGYCIEQMVQRLDLMIPPPPKLLKTEALV
jgi:hypothetical protein